MRRASCHSVHRVPRPVQALRATDDSWEVQPRLAQALAVLTALVALGVVAQGAARREPPAGPAGAPRLDAAARRAGLTITTPLHPADRAMLLGAIAHARPEARRLVAVVDGMVDLRVATIADGVPGRAQWSGGRVTVTIDLPWLWRAFGQRAVEHVLLHELGHAVDFLLLHPPLEARMDAGVPQGLGCAGGRAGACATREERFADSFAKWALGDIGVRLPVGYAVPPPGPTLDAWGAPLAALARE